MKDVDREQQHQRDEHTFDVITFALASLLAMILLAAVGYGIFRSAEVTATIPFPSDGPKTAVGESMPVTEGAGTSRRDRSGNH